MSQLQVLHFLVENVSMCVDLQYIVKVIPLTYLENVPDSPPHLVGLLNLAGQSVPVIDLGIRLGISKYQSYTLETPIMIGGDKDKKVGMMIGKIVGLKTIETDALQLQDELKLKKYFMGVVQSGIGLSLFMNVTYFINENHFISPELIQLDHQLMNRVKMHE